MGYIGYGYCADTGSQGLVGNWEGGRGVGITVGG